MWELRRAQAAPLKTHYGEITMKGRKPDLSMHTTHLFIQTYIPTKYQIISKGTGVVEHTRMCLQTEG